MLRLFSHKKRPFHMGPYPTERLPRASSAPSTPVNPLQPPTARGKTPISAAMAPYFALFETLRQGEVAGGKAPITEDGQARADNLKASCYFIDASMAGICRIPGDAWMSKSDETASHKYALVILVETPRIPRPGDPGDDWLRGSEAHMAALRSAENAIVMASFVRRIGYSAKAHMAGASDLYLERLAVEAGLALPGDNGQPAHPYLGTGYRLAAVSMEFEVAPDKPLTPIRGLGDWWKAKGPGWFLGAGGAKPGFGLMNGENRPLHWGKYPMEKIRRVDSPTTLLTDDIPRVPKRAGFFNRALAGDLGAKAQRERNRFAYKTPDADAYMPIMRSMIPLQDGEVATTIDPNTSDPDLNADSIKAAGYFLGADMVGICEVPEYAWYSHDDPGGAVIEPYHKYAVVMLLDQGYETMEGASGDDWISGAQSMRAYMRGAEIAGVMGEHLRSLGHSARSQTNVDSHVLHIPLILQAGLGELSRIGELVLNPYVGPRFKSVVLTTNMPLTPDKPVDFGLQDFCNKCLKCARECPCSAIPFGPKVMFNGYETWKPDVEKCARYRITNPKGSACGRCMKMCPYNLEGVLSERAVLAAAIHLPFTRKAIAAMDDWVGNGQRNPVKQWWYDLEIVDGITQTPKSGTNKRDLDFDGLMRPEDQKLAHYPADMMPPPESAEPFPVDRKAGLARAAEAEDPRDLKAR